MTDTDADDSDDSKRISDMCGYCRILGIVVLCVSTVLVAVMVDTGSKDVGDY